MINKNKIMFFFPTTWITHICVFLRPHSHLRNNCARDAYWAMIDQPHTLLQNPAHKNIVRKHHVSDWQVEGVCDWVKKGGPLLRVWLFTKSMAVCHRKRWYLKRHLLVTSGIMNSLWMVFSTNRLQNFKPTGTVEMSLNNRIIWDKKTRYPLSS